jgi:hypothetical protein
MTLTRLIVTAGGVAALLGPAGGPSPAQGIAPTPALTGVLPAAVKRGTTVQIVLLGSNLLRPREIAVSGAGVRAKPVPGGTARRCPVTLQIDRQAELGRRELRLVTIAGVSNAARLLIVRRADSRAPR